MPSIHTLAWGASAAKNGLTATAAIADAAHPGFTVSGNNITLPNRNDLEIIAILGHSSVTAAKANRIGLHSDGGEFGAATTAPALRWSVNNLTPPFMLPHPIKMKPKSTITGYSDNTNTNEISNLAILVRATGEPKTAPLPAYRRYIWYDIPSLTAGADVWTTDMTWTLPGGVFDTSKKYHVLGVWGSITDGGFGRFTDPMGKSVWRPGFRFLSGPAAALLATVGGVPHGMITAYDLKEVYAEFKGDQNLTINALDSAGNADGTVGLWIGEVP